MGRGLQLKQCGSCCSRRRTSSWRLQRKRCDCGVRTVARPEARPEAMCSSAGTDGRGSSQQGRRTRGRGGRVGERRRERRRRVLLRLQRRAVGAAGLVVDLGARHGHGRALVGWQVAAEGGRLLQVCLKRRLAGLHTDRWISRQHYGPSIARLSPGLAKYSIARIHTTLVVATCRHNLTRTKRSAPAGSQCQQAARQRQTHPKQTGSVPAGSRCQPGTWRQRRRSRGRLCP